MFGFFKRKIKPTPYIPCNTELPKNDLQYKQRLLIGTATTGLVRIEWAFSRFGVIVPCNWSHGSFLPSINACAPLGYTVADAQNAIVAKFIDGDFEWLLLHEQDNLLQPNAFMLFNNYMIHRDVPIVSGIYFTKSMPAEPLIYRGRGTSYYADWKLGDLVWVDGVPTGLLLIHRSLIKVLWDESEEYVAGGNIKTRKVFTAPEASWNDPEKGWQVHGGTSDLEFCSRLIVQNIFAKAGWPEYQKKQYPILCDTNILSTHIAENGVAYPSPPEIVYWSKSLKQRLKEREDGRN